MKKPKCKLCGSHVEAGELSQDHIIPRLFGGLDAEWNLQTVHRRCNSRRGPGRLPAQIPMILEAEFVFDDGLSIVRPFNTDDRRFLEQHFQNVAERQKAYRERSR